MAMTSERCVHCAAAMLCATETEDFRLIKCLRCHELVAQKRGPIPGALRHTHVWGSTEIHLGRRKPCPKRKEGKVRVAEGYVCWQCHQKRAPDWERYEEKQRQKGKAKG